MQVESNKKSYIVTFISHALGINTLALSECIIICILLHSDLTFVVFGFFLTPKPPSTFISFFSPVTPKTDFHRGPKSASKSKSSINARLICYRCEIGLSWPLFTFLAVICGFWRYWVPTFGNPFYILQGKPGERLPIFFLLL
jgi:hypothetical protein